MLLTSVSAAAHTLGNNVSTARDTSSPIPTSPKCPAVAGRGYPAPTRREKPLFCETGGGRVGASSAPVDVL